MEERGSKVIADAFFPKEKLDRCIFFLQHTVPPPLVVGGKRIPNQKYPTSLALDNPTPSQPLVASSCAHSLWLQDSFY